MSAQADLLYSKKKSPSGWERPTSIITIFDINANPSAMLAICDWSGEAEITGGKMDTNKMLIRHGLQVAPLALAGGASWFPHHFPVHPSQGAAGMLEGVLFSARSRDAALPLVCLCLHGIHLLIWIYANAAVVPTVKGRAPTISIHHHCGPLLLPTGLCSHFPALFLSVRADSGLMAVGTSSALSQRFKEEWDC